LQKIPPLDVLSNYRCFRKWEKYTYQENIISCNAKKLDNAGEKAGQFSEMTGSFFHK
jgi:hypothetical protein